MTIKIYYKKRNENTGEERSAEYIPGKMLDPRWIHILKFMSIDFHPQMKYKNRRIKILKKWSTSGHKQKRTEKWDQLKCFFFCSFYMEHSIFISMQWFFWNWIYSLTFSLFTSILYNILLISLNDMVDIKVLVEPRLLP